MEDDSRQIAPKVQAAGGTSGKPPRERPPATASGGHGGGDLRAGQKVACIISHAEPGGYTVTIPRFNAKGFLPTEAELQPGAEMFATFVCHSNSRILLQARFESSKASDRNY